MIKKQQDVRLSGLWSKMSQCGHNWSEKGSSAGFSPQPSLHQAHYIVLFWDCCQAKWESRASQPLWLLEKAPARLWWGAEVLYSGVLGARRDFSGEFWGDPGLSWPCPSIQPENPVPVRLGSHISCPRIQPGGLWSTQGQDPCLPAEIWALGSQGGKAGQRVEGAPSYVGLLSVWSLFLLFSPRSHSRSALSSFVWTSWIGLPDDI